VEFLFCKNRRALLLKHYPLKYPSMNFYNVIIYGYLFLASVIIFIILRDRKNPKLYLGKKQTFSLFLIALLMAGALMAIDARFIEPWILRVNKIEITNSKIKKPLKIAFISDIQVGNDKKEDWVEKIVKKIRSENPDLVILGGDQIDNEGTFTDESANLEPLTKITLLYPTYAVMGNHEYGIGSSVIDQNEFHTADQSKLLIDRLQKLNIKLLRNNLDCPIIKNQKICLFGIDDIWKKQNPNFSALINYDYSTPLIFITHNPDGIKYWPQNAKKPDLVLSGHTHGGQVWLPLIGPMANPGIKLPKKYFRGLNYYPTKNTDNLDSRLRGNDKKVGIPIYTSVGAGESGGSIRFLTLPEIVIINLKPQE